MTNEEYARIHQIVLKACELQRDIRRNDFPLIFSKSHLPRLYFYNKWRENKRFVHVYLNMDLKHNEMVAQWLQLEKSAIHVIRAFYMFAYNWNTKGNFFKILWGDQADQYIRKTGWKSGTIHAEQICNFFLKLTENEQLKVLRFVFERYSPNAIRNNELVQKRHEYIEEQAKAGVRQIVLPKELAFTDED